MEQSLPITHPLLLFMPVCDVSSVDSQLAQLEAALAAADAPTLELLGQSTSHWLQTAQPLPSNHQTQQAVRCSPEQLQATFLQEHNNSTSESASAKATESCKITSDGGSKPPQHAASPDDSSCSSKLDDKARRAQGLLAETSEGKAVWQQGKLVKEQQ